MNGTCLFGLFIISLVSLKLSYSTNNIRIYELWGSTHYQEHPSPLAMVKYTPFDVGISSAELYASFHRFMIITGLMTLIVAVCFWYDASFWLLIVGQP